LQSKLEAVDVERYMDMCICGTCASYPGHTEKSFYCGRGKSEYEVDMKDCICASCAVFDELRLSDRFYCVHGSAK
jgi:hypothetical protein